MLSTERFGDLRKVLYLISVSILALGDAFHTTVISSEVLPHQHYTSTNHQSTTVCYATFKFSPAVVSNQDAETVRRIRKQRSNRGKTHSENVRKPRRRKASTTEKEEEDEIWKELQTPPDIRNRIQSSKNLGRTAKGFDLSYESTLNALRIYYKENSNLILPRRFVVPEGSTEYPAEWHGIDLAGTVYDMAWWQRHVKQKPDRVAELNMMGFVWERLQPEWNLVLEALITYQAIHGNLLVPAKFVVPYGDSRWPKATWGSNLGNSVYRIRNRGDFLQGGNSGSRRDQLDSIGFVWDVHEHRFKKFYRALSIYSRQQNQKNIGGRKVSLKVPSTFVVPVNSEEWPKELWGYRLGTKCKDVLGKQVYVKGHPERLKMLADIGFHIGGNDSLSWLSVVHAAAVYSQMNQRTLDVPAKFVVPAPPRLISNDEVTSPSGSSVVGSDEAWPWPDYLWGFPLGQRLKDIRLKGYYLRCDQAEVRRRQLDALGFNWTPRRGRPKSKRAD